MRVVSWACGVTMGVVEGAGYEVRGVAVLRDPPEGVERVSVSGRAWRWRGRRRRRRGVLQGGVTARLILL